MTHRSSFLCYRVYQCHADKINHGRYNTYIVEVDSNYFKVRSRNAMRAVNSVMRFNMLLHADIGEKQPPTTPAPPPPGKHCKIARYDKRISPYTMQRTRPSAAVTAKRSLCPIVQKLNPDEAKQMIHKNYQLIYPK